MPRDHILHTRCLNIYKIISIERKCLQQCDFLLTIDHDVRVALLDFSKGFDLINHNALLVTLKRYDLPPHIRRWISTFLLDRVQQVKLGNHFSPPGHPR